MTPWKGIFLVKQDGCTYEHRQWQHAQGLDKFKPEHAPALMERGGVVNIAPHSNQEAM